MTARPVEPPFADHSLTPAGREVVDRLTPLLDWLHAYVDDRVGDRG